MVENKEEALRTAKKWDRPDTVWTDGSRQVDGAVDAACVWRSPKGGWTGRRFQLGKINEVLDAEVFAVWQAGRWSKGMSATASKPSSWTRLQPS